MTLVDFLLARIAEDEDAARVATGKRWHGQACEVRTLPRDTERATEPYWFQICSMFHDNHFRDALHIARWDPARVLAECAAKRWIVEGLAGIDLLVGLNPSLPVLAREWLQSLAAPYADHPDYRKEWRL